MDLYIAQAIKKRANLIRPPYDTAFRLLNGFTEDVPDLVIEIFGKTVVYHDYSEDKYTDAQLLKVRDQFPWLTFGLIKKRKAKDPKEKNGIRLFGTKITKRIQENGVWYAIDLNLNRDASFYLDTRNLRAWAKENLEEKSVLNTFAYTGSIGIAALVGGASEVIHLDLSRTFLEIAKRSTHLNGKPLLKSDYQVADFWSRINQYKKNGKHFDCVVLDPPVYAKTAKGIIDIANHYDKLINKVRPIIKDGGYLVTINNALFVSGQDHQDDLKKLCESGYLNIEQTIDIPEDCIGNPNGKLPADPSPYNHATKITILRVKKK